MKEYMKPLAELIDFTTESIMSGVGGDGEIDDGFSDVEGGSGVYPGGRPPRP